MKKAPLSLATLSLTAGVLGGGAGAVRGAGLDITPGTLITTLPFNDTGTTIGFVNDINSHDPFNGYISSAGPDVFYTFSVASSGLITLSCGFGAVADSDHDATLGLFTGSSSAPAWVTGTDVNTQFNSNPNEVIVDFPVTAGTTYHILLDGYYANSQGAYTLNVSGSGGLVLAVPEPRAALPGALAAGAAAWRRRRRGKV